MLKLTTAYDAYKGNLSDVIAEDSDRVALLARGETNIRLSGKGMIEAPGADYITGWLEDMGTHIPAARRPRVLVLQDCRNIVLEDLTIRRSPMWTVHLICCRNVQVHGLRVDNDRAMPNTDGIVVDACEQVQISGCDIATADDGIVLKTSAGPDGKAAGACRNIHVSHCRLQSRSCALKIGTESYGDFENIAFSDCEVTGSNRALGIFSRDGGRISNVVFQRITLDCEQTPDGFWGSGEAITVNSIDRRSSQPAGSVQNLIFEDISGRMEGTINLIADSASGIRNVWLRRIGLRQEQGDYGALAYDLRPTRFELAPSEEAAGRANAWVKDENGAVIGLVPYPGGMPGLYALNVEGLCLDAVDIRRPATLPEGWNDQVTVVAEGQTGTWS